MYYPKDTINWKTELLYQPYRQERLQFAEQERQLQSLKSNQTWSKRFTCVVCKLVFNWLVRPLYQQLKQQVESGTSY